MTKLMVAFRNFANARKTVNWVYNLFLKFLFERDHAANYTYNHSPGIHDKDPVRIHNCVQTVSDR